jgi:hypothetical protein
MWILSFIKITFSTIHFLLSVVKGISSLSPRERRTIRIEFKPCKVNLTHTLRIPTGRSKQPFAFHSGSWIRSTTSDCRTVRTPNVCRTYVCSATTKPVFLSAMQNVLPHVGAWEEPNYSSGGSYVHLPGRLVTRLTAYHISWYVASTFKRLATTTTRYDLIHF